MEPGVTITLAVSFISTLTLCASFLLKDPADEKPARYAFRLAYFCAAVFFVLVALQIDRENPLAALAAKLCLALINASLMQGVIWRSKIDSPPMLVYLLAILYFAVDTGLQELSLVIAYGYNAVAGMICVYYLLNRQPSSNVGDRGMAVIIALWTFVMVANVIARVTQTWIDVPFYLDSMTFVFVIGPAYASGLSLFLISSYMLDTQNALALQATTDSLTGLHNRRYFTTESPRYLSAARRHKQPISLIMCDIDHFKRINDQYGHDLGDIAIQAFAHTLKRVSRNDDLLCRYGGEEFIALLPQTDLASATQVAERMRNETETLTLPSPLNDVSLSASFGVCGISNYDDIEHAISAADSALYQAKNSGRNRIEIASPALRNGTMQVNQDTPE